jgi:hypothetical protein
MEEKEKKAPIKERVKNWSKETFTRGNMKKNWEESLARRNGLYHLYSLSHPF